MSLHRFGTGPAPVLALHCSLAHGGAFRGLGRALAARATLIAPDLPGHGSGPPWPGPGRGTQAAQALAEGLLDRPMHVLGHSWGGVVALRLAAAHSGRVLSLTLLEPVLHAAAAGRPGHAAEMAAEARVRALLAAGEAEAAARAFATVWGGVADWAALAPERRAQLAAGMPMAMGEDAAINGPGPLLAPGGLEALAVPVLLLEGAESPPVIAEIMEAVAARLPDARRAAIPGAGHMLPVTHPGPVAARIAAFLDCAACKA